MSSGRIPSVEGGIQPTIVDAKGDLIVATAADTVSRLAVGSNNNVLMADSTQSTGLKYAAEATATLTTTGDMLYASAANTLARRAIGSTGDVLTVSGGLPTWAAPSASAENFSLISSTSLTSGSTVTISGISGKNTLLIKLQDVSSTSASTQFSLRFNSDSGSNYQHIGWESGSSSNITSFNNWSTSSIYFAQMGNAAANEVQGMFLLHGCNSAGIKPYEGIGASGGTSYNQRIMQGFYTGTSTISSVSIICGAGSFDTGTFAVYGA